MEMWLLPICRAEGRKATSRGEPEPSQSTFVPILLLCRVPQGQHGGSGDGGRGSCRQAGPGVAKSRLKLVGQFPIHPNGPASAVFTLVVGPPILFPELVQLF